MFRALPAMLFDAPGNRLLLPCQASLPSCPQGPTGYGLDAQNAKQGGQWPQVILGWTVNERRATADSRTATSSDLQSVSAAYNQVLNLTFLDRPAGLLPGRAIQEPK